MYVIQTNLYAILIALIIFFSLYLQKDYTPRNHRHFFRMIILTILLLMVDLTSELTNGQAGTLMRIVHSGSLVLLFSLSGYVGVYWFLYIYHYVYVHKTLSKPAVTLLILPATMIVVMAVMSLFTDVLFFIDAQNVYHRGPFFMAQAVLMYAYALAALLVIIVNITRLSKRDWLPLLTVPVFPLVGGWMQIRFYGLLILLPMIVLSMLIVYIFIQSKRIGIDVLTGVLNRREYDIYVRTIRANRKMKTTIGALMIDINHFKQINDTLGHHIGDQVLRYVGETLQKVFYPEQTLFRIGGDEFFVFIKLKESQMLTDRVTALKKSLQTDNPFDFPLELSIGAACFNATKHGDLATFIAHVDALMYRDKEKNR